MVERGEQRRWNAGRNERFAAGGVCLVITVVSVAFLANSMLKPLSRDEHMYCTAGALVAQGKAIYQDFAYPSQLPYHPLLLAAVYRTLGTTHYLLLGRLVSVFSDITILVLIVAIYRRAFEGYRFEGWLFGLAGALLHAFNPSITWACGYAWNHDVVLLCVVLSFWLFLTMDFRRRVHLCRPALMGGLLMLATCMRVTTALVTALFLVALFVRPSGSLTKRMRAVLPFTLAALVVLTWPLWISIQASQAVRINLLQIPALYAQWLHDRGMAFGKVRLALAVLTTPGYLALLVAGGYLAAVTAKRWPDVTPQTRRNLALAALLAAAFIVIAFIPPTMWDQYWAMPVPFLVIGLAFPLAQLCTGANSPSGAGRLQITRLVVLICVLLTIGQNIPFLFRVTTAWRPTSWVPLQVHKTAGDLAKRLPEDGPVLTLGPLYALESGRDIYPELASGSIVYRVADAMSPDQRTVTHTVGPKSLKVLLQKSPPAGAILGVETSPAGLEASLREAIPSACPIEEYDTGLAVYSKP